MLRKIRITLAAVMFIGITLLFLDFTGTMHQWVSWMPKIQFLEAVLALNVVVIAALILLTLIFGRMYCSVICPLGVMQDIIAWFGKKARKNRYSYSKAKHGLRVLFFTLMLMSIVLGVSVIVQLLAPYSAFGRIATNLLQPLYIGGNNMLATIAEASDSYLFYHHEVWMRSLVSLIIAAATFGILFLLAWRNGRTWCNTICPVGTALAVFAKFSWMKIRFDEQKCRNCSMCSKNCKAACIDYKNHTVDYTRCVVCGDCIESCKFGALKYARATQQQEKQQTKQREETDTGRRSFLIGATLASTAVMAQEKKKVDGGLAAIAERVIPERQTPLTPPGSLSAQNMAKRCTGCQLCISECPNDVLRPSTDLMTLMQPTMSYERGYCRPECTRCSEVCPAGAIQPITPIEKSAI